MGYYSWSTGRSHARIEATRNGALLFFSSYDAGLVAALKAAIPPSERQWDKDQKAWIVGPQYGGVLADLAVTHLGVKRPEVPKLSLATPKPETKLVRLEYLGTAKDRGKGECVAFGYCDGSWSLAFPLEVLRKWFEPGEQPPTDAPTLYGKLGVRQDVVPVDLKKAWRRLARQWHPDVCHEPDAKEQFQAIQEAYTILSNPATRAKYDAGLTLQASLAGQAQSNRGAVGPYASLADTGYRPPLRCGLLLVEGVPGLGRMRVNRVLRWDDITDSTGRVMVSFWPRGADTFSVRWV